MTGSSYFNAGLRNNTASAVNDANANCDESEKAQQSFIKFTVPAPAVFAFHLALGPESRDARVNVQLGDEESDCLQ